MAAAAILAIHRAEEELNRDHGPPVVGNDDIYANVQAQQSGFSLSSCFEKNNKVLPLDADGKPITPVEVAEDYYANPEYWPNAPAPLRWYLSLCKKSRYLVEDSQPFNNAVTVVICIAGINVGLQTYPGMDSNYYVGILDMVILAVFTLELLIKFCMEGFKPWVFFINKDWAWNIFDLAIVMLSYPVWGLQGGSSIALLRLVRLARLGKLVKKIPALQMIIKGLAGGLSSITYIMLLLFLVFYLFGVVGFYAFSVNDPFHFGTLPLSMMTLFRMATMENWGDIMFLNIFGCDTYADMYVPPEGETTENHIFWCRNPGSNWMLGPAYFVSFIVIASFVMLSLFIGAVTISMTESMMELKEMNLKKKAEEAVEHNMKRMEAIMKRKAIEEKQQDKERKKLLRQLQREREIARDGYIARPESPESLGRDSPDTLPESTKSGESMTKPGQTAMSSKLFTSAKNDEPDEEDELDKSEEEHDPESIEGLQILKSKSIFLKWWYQHKISVLQKIHDDAAEIKENIGKALRIAVGQDTMDKEDLTEAQIEQNAKDHVAEPKGIAALYLKWAHVNKWAVYHPKFSSFMTFVIVIASLNVGFQTDWRIMRHQEWVDALNYLDAVILYIFTAEIVMKFFGFGFSPLTYFKDGWNKFDFLIVAGSFVPGLGSSVTMLRLLRLLRVLKLVKRLPQLAVIINALLNGLVSIAYVGLVLLLFFYVFAIVGMMLFEVNDPWHFGSLHMAFLSLFQAATLDNWSMLMYTSQHGCDKYPGIYETYPEQCVTPQAHGLVAVFYFLMFVIIGAQVLLSLFIGVISTSMDEAQEKQNRERELEEKIEKTAKKLLIDEKRVEALLYVFSQLDLDNGGTIEEDELKIGMEAIGSNMSLDDIIRILQKVAPDGEGVDPNGFILFMYETPLFNRSNAIAKFNNAMSVKTRTAKVAKPGWLKQWLIDIFVYGGRAHRIHLQEMEAALAIQDAWTDRKAAKKAKKEAEEYIKATKIDQAARRRNIMASKSSD